MIEYQQSNVKAVKVKGSIRRRERASGGQGLYLRQGYSDLFLKLFVSHPAWRSLGRSKKKEATRQPNMREHHWLEISVGSQHIVGYAKVVVAAAA